MGLLIHREDRAALGNIAPLALLSKLQLQIGGSGEHGIGTLITA